MDKVKTPSRTCPEQILDNLKRRLQCLSPQWLCGVDDLLSLGGCSDRLSQREDAHCSARRGIEQNVYDPNENKIGDVKDVLVDKTGKVVALIVAVGGFLGAGEKDVAVPFEAVHPTMKDKKWWLVMNTTKDSLKSAPGFKYNSSSTTWVPDRP